MLGGIQRRKRNFPAMIGERAAATLEEAFRFQAASCRELQAPFTAALLEQLGDHLDTGILAQLFAKRRHSRAALRDSVALRLAGAIHYGVRAALASPRLRAIYQRAQEDDALWPEVEKFLRANSSFVASFLQGPPQTNEVMRSAALLGGFLEIGRLDMPLALCELGSSAGLNLHWDRFYYRAQNFCWGDADSPLTLPVEWRGAPPFLNAPIRIARREGCDRAPLDPSQEEHRMRLQSYIWPEQKERLARQQTALQMAAHSQQKVVPADALDFCRQALQNRRAGELLVIYHSVFWQYLSRTKQQAIKTLIEQAGSQKNAPLAWLSMEPYQGGDRMETRLRLWQKGQKTERRLATSGAHGRPVIWL